MKSTDLLMKMHSRVWDLLESLKSDPNALISDELFVEKFSRLERALAQLFASEDKHVRQAGISVSEKEKHIEDHNRLISVTLNVYEAAMVHQKVTAAEVYKTLKTHMDEHVRQHDMKVFPIFSGDPDSPELVHKAAFCASQPAPRAS